MEQDTHPHNNDNDKHTQSYSYQRLNSRTVGAVSPNEVIHIIMSCYIINPFLVRVKLNSTAFRGKL